MFAFTSWKQNTLADILSHIKCANISKEKYHKELSLMKRVHEETVHWPVSLKIIEEHQLRNEDKMKNFSIKKTVMQNFVRIKMIELLC